MPFGLGWLADVRDYFLRAPMAMVVAVIALHFLCRKLDRQYKKKEYDDYDD